MISFSTLKLNQSQQHRDLVPPLLLSRDGELQIVSPGGAPRSVCGPQGLPILSTVWASVPLRDVGNKGLVIGDLCAPAAPLLSAQSYDLLSACCMRGCWVTEANGGGGSGLILCSFHTLFSHLRLPQTFHVISRLGAFVYAVCAMQMHFPSWKTPPACRRSSRVTSSMKCAVPTSDASS